MDVILLDTNIVSFLLKMDSRAILYAPYLEGRIQAISLMTVAELYQWAAIRYWGDRRIEDMEQTLKKYLIFPIDRDLCCLCGHVRAKCRAAGQPISPQDAWIAATALHYHLSLVTHNPSDFEIVEGLDVLTTIR